MKLPIQSRPITRMSNQKFVVEAKIFPAGDGCPRGEWCCRDPIGGSNVCISCGVSPCLIPQEILCLGVGRVPSTGC